MAFNCLKTSPIGQTETYWKIGQANINWVARVAEVQVLGYRSLEAREVDDGRIYEERKVFIIRNVIEDIDDVNTQLTFFDDVFSAEVLNSLDQEPRRRIYDYLKANEEFFKDAIDV